MEDNVKMNKNDIFITYGNDARAMTKQLLDVADINSLITDKNASIGLKPNLAVAKPSHTGATTTPLIVETVVEYLQNSGYTNICIIESSWLGDSTKRAFSVCGYDAISQKYNVPLYDVKDDEYETYTQQGIDIEVSKKVMQLDFLINIPVLKGHCQTSVTFALKNIKGCISDKSKRHFHTLGLHKPIAVLSNICKPQLIIADSLNGDLDFEEGGNPLQTNRMLLAQDSVLIDAYGAALMGYEPYEVEYIKMAHELGVGSANINSANVIELNKDKKTPFATVPGRAKQLEKYTNANSACSACYGNLINALARMQDKGRLSNINKKLFIGQHFKNVAKNEYGIGSCCCKFEKHVPGCPPKALDIVHFLETEF